MKNFLLLILIFLICSCNKEQNNLTVKVNIEGLKKGYIYLKKQIDSTYINVDSVAINGTSEIQLHSNIDSPQVLFLYLDKNSNENDAIAFFADKGITEINTTLKKFPFDAKINGCKQQKTLEEYNLLISNLNKRKLDFIKDEFYAKKNNDTIVINNIINKRENLLKLKYLSTVNFAINNKDSEVAPYIALTQLSNARIHFLDTINNSLTNKVKNSKYGKELQQYIETIKSIENK